MPEWRKVKYLGSAEKGYRFELILPRPLADWDVFNYWEKERIESLAKNLTENSVVYDIGTEHGWLTVALAKATGGARNMVLIEPTKEFWPNIRQTWERNDLDTPLACYPGLLGTEDYGATVGYKSWPQISEGSPIDKNRYTYLHEQNNADRTTVDSLRGMINATPDALNIDVEGAELEVLRGARNILMTAKPFVWVSIHPDLMHRDWGYRADRVHSFMKSLGYESKHLATDHEQHWFFYHPEGAKRAAL